METVLASAIAVLGTLLGSITTITLQQRTAQKAEQRTALAAAAAKLAHALSTHRGHLYRRWELAQPDTSTTPDELEAARRTSHASRDTVTGPLYQLRALTTDQELIRLAVAAVDAAYAVKRKGEDLASVSAADIAARRDWGIAADHALLAAVAERVAPR
ncbi:hypothetical protein [Streptomyces javensis]|uniref:Protein kilB n=1 Tax=Streptomyces javensis TaxID=114698 RepID=A0ABS0RSQ6_9ACTN|nr:hypothetical protein [Streptomyces javensis]MBI0319672.1 hypothetical protein [Streptomyces javensis]